MSSKTKQIADKGGQALHEQIQMLCAMHDTDVVCFALTQSLVAFGIFVGDSPAEAHHMLRTMAEDAVRGVDLNWHDLHARVRLMSTQMQQGGRGVQ